MKTEVKKIDDLLPDPNNINKHTQRGHGLVENSIRRRGVGRGILAAGKNTEKPVIMAGNLTHEKARDAGIDEVVFVHTTGNQLVVNVRDDLDPTSPEAIALGIEDNESGKLSYNPDIDLLAAMAAGDNGVLSKLKEDDKIFGDMLAGMGVKNGEPVDAELQIDRAAELAEKWATASGQLWKLGDHRLLIGDCTVRENVERLMGGEKIDLLFTSPPYAEQREYEVGKFDWDALMFGMSGSAFEFSKENISFLVNLGLVHVDGKVFRYWDNWISWMEDKYMPLYGWYIWDKLSGLMGDWHGRLAPAHEFIFHFSKNPRQAHKTTQTKYAEQGVTHYKKNKVGLRGKDGTMNGFTSAGKEVNQTKIIDSVIRVQPQRGGMEGHPAPFSVEFAQTVIEVFSDVGHIVYEPFCGSGTSILACQNLARKCYSTELSDKYAGIILERFYTATGITPELVTE